MHNLSISQCLPLVGKRGWFVGRPAGRGRGFGPRWARLMNIRARSNFVRPEDLGERIPPRPQYVCPVPAASHNGHSSHGPDLQDLMSAFLPAGAK